VAGIDAYRIAGQTMQQPSIDLAGRVDRCDYADCPPSPQEHLHYAYCDIRGEARPILVVDTGSAEIHFSMPIDRITVEDLRIVDLILEALAAFRLALLAYLDLSRCAADVRSGLRHCGCNGLLPESLRDRGAHRTTT
jgi:hypothetical protein